MSDAPVAVVHNAVPPGAPADERDVLDQVEAVGAALTRNGHAWQAVPADLDLGALRARLDKLQPALAFNLVESLGGSSVFAPLAPAFFAGTGLPFTGSDAAALALTGDKRSTAARLRAAGVPVPAALDETADPASWTLAWIVKPALEDASVGIDDHSVCADGAAAVQRLRACRGNGGEWFAEQFIDGREFVAGLLQDGDGVRVLPVAEIHFRDFPAEKPRILAYDAKWAPDSFAGRNTPRGFGIEVAEPVLAAGIAELARRCWDACGLRGYARVDFRVDAQGNPWVVDVNANPCLAPDAGFAAMLGQAGIRYEVAVQAICAALAPACAQQPAGDGRVDAQLPAAPPGMRWRLTPTGPDRAAVRALAVAAGNFSAAEIDIAVELVDTALCRGAAGGYRFVFLLEGDTLRGFACFGDIPGSTVAHDIYWIIVDPGYQGTGLGRRILQAVEACVRAAGGSRIFIDTSGNPHYEATRAFYLRCGYQLEAELADFYAAGDSKCIFSRTLAGAS